MGFEAPFAKKLNNFETILKPREDHKFILLKFRIILNTYLDIALRIDSMTPSSSNLETPSNPPLLFWLFCSEF